MKQRSDFLDLLNNRNFESMLNREREGELLEERETNKQKHVRSCQRKPLHFEPR